MKKYLVLSTITVLVSLSSTFAQTTREKVEKAMNDPKARENEAKADDRLIDKKNVTDSASYDTAPVAAKKERPCLFKRKKKSGKKTL